MTSQALRTSSVVISKIASSVEAPPRVSPATWSSYFSPLARAEAKIVGLVVTPTTCLSATRAARLPVSMRSRDRSSSQMLTPAAESSARGPDSVFLSALIVSSSRWGGASPRQTVRSPLRDADALLGGGHDRGGRDAELLVELGVRRTGAVVVQGHRPSGIADELLPALGDRRLDRDPRTDLG